MKPNQPSPVIDDRDDLDITDMTQDEVIAALAKTPRLRVSYNSDLQPLGPRGMICVVNCLQINRVYAARVARRAAQESFVAGFGVGLVINMAIELVLFGLAAGSAP